jgi:UPF0755 protein
MKNKTSRSSSCSYSLLLILFALLALAVVLTAALIIYIPGVAQSEFGPPDSGLKKTRQVLYAAILLVQQNDLIRPASNDITKQPFHVNEGETTPSVVGRLYEDGLIRNPGAFSTYLQYSGLDRSLQAGNYELSPAMSALEIAHAMQDATPKEVSFTILPGWRLDEIAAALPTSGLSILPQEFLNAAHSRPQGVSFASELSSPANLEGFLLPGTVTVPRDVTVDQLLTILMQPFETQVSEEIRQGFNRQGLSLFQAVTLASIVERESMQTDEMPMIASVFYNRLDKGMKLDSDPTVQYALGYNRGSWWTNPLTLEDLKVDSYYNTYIYPGLPPGPIAAPSLDALRAVAFPAKTPYYYFRAACDGSGRHVFSETFEEHVQKSCP